MTLVEDSELVSKCLSNRVFFACQSIIYERCNHANIVHLKVEFFFFLLWTSFRYRQQQTASAKKESQYGAKKILVIFTTIAKLVYKHAAGEYY